MRGLFITGTDTGVGKTWAACAIVTALRAAGRKVGAYKPVCSGCETAADGSRVWSDVDALCRALGGDAAGDLRLARRVCPQTFAAPLAPPVAAALEGGLVDRSLLRSGVEAWRERADLLVVEGAGGLRSPIAAAETNLELARDLGWPLVVVAANRLGVVNHTLLTIECAARQRLRVAGVVLNDTSPDVDLSTATNARLLAEFLGPIPCWRLTHGGPRIVAREPSAAELDWWSIADVAPAPGESA